VEGLLALPLQSN